MLYFPFCLGNFLLPALPMKHLPYHQHSLKKTCQKLSSSLHHTEYINESQGVKAHQCSTTAKVPVLSYFDFFSSVMTGASSTRHSCRTEPRDARLMRKCPRSTRKSHHGEVLHRSKNSFEVLPQNMRRNVIIIIGTIRVDIHKKVPSIVQEMSLNGWLEIPQHKNCCAFSKRNPGFKDCFIAYTDQSPCTHLFVAGYSLHINQPVPITLTLLTPNTHDASRTFE